MSDDANAPCPGLLARLRLILREESQELRPRQHLLSALSRAIPRQVGHELRAQLLRLRGVRVGDGASFADTPTLTGPEPESIGKFHVGAGCDIDIGCTFELGESITLGERVTIGPQTLIITTTHELGKREHRAGPVVRRPVVIHAGAWVGARVIILPGVTIGEGAIVDSGSVVNKDVAPHTRVRGTPARQVEELVPTPAATAG